MRGNFAEAAMSAVAAIPFAGDAVGAVKVAGKGAKLVTKSLSKAQRIMSVLQGLYVSAQAAFAIYQMKDQIADMWKRLKNGENIFANPADVSLLFNLAGSGVMATRGVKSVGKGMIGKKLEFSGGKTPKGGDSSPSKPRKGIKDKVKGLGEKLQNLLTGGDPINVVTGSFLMQYIGLQLRDTVGLKKKIIYYMK